MLAGRTHRYPARTEKNVKAADASIIFATTPPTKGVALTIQYAKKSTKPCLIIDLDNLSTETHKKLVGFLSRRTGQIINVAGPRQTSYKQGSAYQLTYEFLLSALQQVNDL